MKYNKLHVLASYYKADRLTKMAILDHFQRPMINDKFMKGLCAEELAKWYLMNYVGLDIKCDDVQNYIYDYREPIWGFQHCQIVICVEFQLMLNNLIILCKKH